MKQIRNFLLVIFGLCFLIPLYAGSVRLINDSPYKLRVVIRGADGTQLGEMVLNPDHSSSWNDSQNHTGWFGKGNNYQERATSSQTPYTVLWYCLDGSDYSFIRYVATGATVKAQSGDGARICSPAKKKSGPYPNQPEGQDLYREPLPESGSE